MRNFNHDSATSLEWLPAATVKGVLGGDYPLVGKASLPEQICYLEHVAVALFALCPAGKREAAIAAINSPTGPSDSMSLVTLRNEGKLPAADVTPTTATPAVKKADGELTGRARIEAAIAKNKDRIRGSAES